MAALMRAATGGDELAYKEFLRAAATMVRGLARRKLAESAVVSPEDIVQETLLAVHLRRHTWRQHEPILPWLFSIARYKVVDAYRRRGTRIFVNVEDFSDSIAAPDYPEIEASTSQIESALDGLSAGQQRVVRAIAVEGRTITETAFAYGMKETAVRVAFHRGLTAIALRCGRVK